MDESIKTAQPAWYIVQQTSEHCEICTGDQLEILRQQNPNQDFRTWGPFASNGEAIARRVGLIRGGKCKPA